MILLFTLALLLNFIANPDSGVDIYTTANTTSVIDMTMPTVLITGANRGLGFGFVEAFAKLGWQVIATCRDVDKMPKVEGDVKVYKLCTDSLTDAHIIAGELEAERIFIDVLISNAAVSIFPGRLVDAPPAVVDLTFQTNARGPLVLFQAMKPLLRDSGKFVVVTSMLGSNSGEPWTRKGSVSMSSAALNSLIRKLHAEHPEIVVMGLDPGSMKTHMGNRGSRWSGRECAAREVSEVIPGLMKVIDDGNAKDHGGVMTDWEGKVVAF